ncbi:MAG: hypothetical protein HMLKMBBP_00679 [Planctomycetes bacterium]|nr:hypothetical protein [Planctomycetota bacterium]
MAKKERPKADEAKPAEFDMTPMIDVTFQLIIFFLIANDLSKKEIVDLQLPQALHSIQDQDVAGEERRVIINLERPKQDPPEKIPTVTVKGQVLEREKLKLYLRQEADKKREGGPGSPSAVFVLIRADRRAPWVHVQYVMQVLADQNIAMYKLQFATTKSADGKSARPQ